MCLLHRFRVHHDNGLRYIIINDPLKCEPASFPQTKRDRFVYDEEEDFATE
jgi:hypothetical protein